MAATSDGSAEIAGNQGMGLLSFTIMQPLKRMQKQIEQYRAAAANPDPITRVANNRVAAYTLVHLMDDETLSADDSVGEIAAALDDLSRGDAASAGARYEEITGRWRVIAALEHAN